MANSDETLIPKVLDHQENQEIKKQLRSAEEMEEEESFSYAAQIATSSVFCMATQSAIELGIFEVLAKAGPDAKLSAKDIASRLSCKNPDAASMIDRVLRLLASHSVVYCSVVAGDEQKPWSFQRLYSTAPVAKYFVKNADGVSLGPFMGMLQDKVVLDTWSQLKDAIVEGGIPFNRVYGIDDFEYPNLDSRFNKLFNTAMINLTTLVITKALESYKGFEDIKTIVDVGGGLGVTLKFITSKYPHIKGINFDLPHVIEHALPYPGVEHVRGDMFESVPKGDAIFMKGILHAWGDEYCLKLLKNCYKAIPDDGKLIVMEAVVSVIPETSAAMKRTSQMDLLMLTVHHGGKERSKEEYMELATVAGFKGIKYECFVRSYWIIEFLK